jgi:hypothetical protein
MACSVLNRLGWAKACLRPAGWSQRRKEHGSEKETLRSTGSGKTDLHPLDEDAAARRIQQDPRVQWRTLGSFPPGQILLIPAATRAETPAQLGRHARGYKLHKPLKHFDGDETRRVEGATGTKLSGQWERRSRSSPSLLRQVGECP